MYSVVEIVVRALRECCAMVYNSACCVMENVENSAWEKAHERMKIMKKLENNVI